MNVYDFDDTILWGDSSVMFYFYCWTKIPFKMLWYLFKTIWWAILYLLKKLSFKEFKENMFSYVCELNNLEKIVNGFWDKKQHRIKEFYLHNQKGDDLIISASFDFLLVPICKRLGIKNLICTKYNLKTGKIIDKNVKDFEKVHLFKKLYKKEVMACAYSDSGSDLPMLEYATKAYVVRGDKLIPLQDYKFNKKVLKKYSKRK